MSKRYTITLSDKAGEKLLRLIGWTEESRQTPAKALQNWLHKFLGLEPPKHGGLRVGGFGRQPEQKKHDK